MKNHYQILVIGGGNAGLSLSAHLLLKNNKLDIGIVEPSDKHYYQPAWTLVGGGVYNIQDTERNEIDYIPKGADWIRDACASFQPESNQVTLQSGSKITYDYLVVCPGIQLDWDKVKGLKETLGKNNVTSNYSFKYAPYTFEVIKNFKGGKALFNNPHTPIKCGGAPHKIMWLAADYFRKNGILDKADIHYYSGGTRLFGVDKYEKTLYKIVERNHIKMHFFERLEEIDGPNKRAKFVGFGENNKDVESWVDFEMFHVTPPQSAPDFIKNSPLANTAGWVDVDKSTLQHNKYKNVFSLGDASSLPTSRTGAAIRKQTPTVANNLLALISGQTMTAAYNGYASCPIVTGYGKLVLAEFDYNNIPMETFPFDQSKERWSMYQLKRQVLPRMYWNMILRGKAQG